MGGGCTRLPAGCGDRWTVWSHLAPKPVAGNAVNLASPNSEVFVTLEDDGDVLAPATLALY